MRKVGIATDSSSDLTQEWVRRLDVPVTPIVVRIDDVDVEVVPDMDREAYFAAVAEGRLTGTSGVNTGRWLEAYGELAARVESVLAVTLSSDMSTTCQAAQLATTLFADRPAAVFDSKTVFTGLASLVMGAAELAMAGEGLEGILDWLNWARPLTATFMITPSLSMLQRIGRMDRGGEDGGTHPLAVVGVERGRFTPWSTAPDFEGALDQVFAAVGARVNGLRPLRLIVDHGRAPDLAARSIERGREALSPHAVVRIDDGLIMPVLADGFGGVALAVGPMP